MCIRDRKRAIYIPSVTEKKFYEQYAQDVYKRQGEGIEFVYGKGKRKPEIQQLYEELEHLG